jgi:antitoxin MazE
MEIHPRGHHIITTVKPMKTTIRPMGNSQGVIIPKPLLAQLGFEGEAEMTVEHGALVLRKPSKPVRAGWAEAAQKIAAAGDDALAMPEFANESDAESAW